MLLGSLDAGALARMLTGKGVIRAGYTPSKKGGRAITAGQD